MVESYADVLFAKGELEGRANATRKIIAKLGPKSLGNADANVTNALNAIADIERLDRMVDRLDEASSWADLLATP